jgi:hypothetical protein
MITIFKFFPTEYVRIEPSWFDILLEEFCEAFLETEPDKQWAEAGREV